MENRTITGATKNTAWSGWINGCIGVLMFSGTVPATKIAVFDLPVTFLTFARAGIAGILALFFILIAKSKIPTRKQFASIGIVAAGAVLVFPLLCALALQHMSSARSLLYVGLIPISTAIFGVIRGRERVKYKFWLFALLGSFFVMGYAFSIGGNSSVMGDLIMLTAVIVCGLGYAEGARLAKNLAGWEVISWALVLSLPIVIPAVIYTMPNTLTTVSADAWIGVGYLGVFSQFLGFIFWYRGLAQGGIARVGQLQLLQSFFGLGIVAVLLQEQISVGMLAVCVCVVVCVATSKKYGAPVGIPTAESL
ncbi:DMT family transporter [Sphingobacterium sp. Mn56C]|uniref:DMT family transporter n=1 Tax=Sphingobacterium sp. Mn56C TaxID=3395261 RepID=UPI003BCC2342